MFKQRFAVGVLLVLLTGRASAGLVSMNTQSHPVPSTVSIELYLGGPPGTGLLLATTGPVEVVGAAQIDLNLDAANSGTAVLESSEIVLASYGPTTIDLGVAGTIDLQVEDLHVSAMGPAKVTNTDARSIAGTYVEYSFYQGVASAFNPSGVIAQLFAGIGPSVTLDFGQSPLSNRLLMPDGYPLGTADQGPGLFSPAPEYNFHYGLQTPLFVSGITLNLTINADFHFAAVPEPSTWTLALSAIAWGIARKSRRKTC